MNDTSAATDAPAFPGRPAAIGLGIALLVALALVLVLAWRDNSQRASLETTAELTAVGDAHYFPFPAQIPLPPYPAVASLHGQELYPTDYVRHVLPADDMTRVGSDEKGGCIIYQAPPEAKDASDPTLGTVYFLKISPKEYLRVSAKEK